MALMNSEFPFSRNNDTEFKDLENICLQVYINDRKWLVMGLCKPPSINNNDFSKYCTKSLDKCMIHYENILVLCDLNFDMLDNQKGTTRSLNSVSLFLLKGSSEFISAITPPPLQFLPRLRSV
jgi:hypothetical protein